MARLSINEVTTYRWTFEEDVANLAEARIPAIGVWRRKLSDFGEERGIELLAESGLAVSNLLWAGGFTGSDGRSYRDSIDDALDAVRLAAQMRAGCLVVYTGARAGHTHNHARRLTREALAKVMPLAEELGVTLGIEPMHPDSAAECTFLTSLEDAIALVEALESPLVRLVFDTYHFGHLPGVVDRLAELAPRIAVVHLADSKGPPDREQNRSRLGEGSLPLGEIVAALSAGGYDGDYDVELMGEEIEVSDYRELLRQTKATFQKLLG